MMEEASKIIFEQAKEKALKEFPRYIEQAIKETGCEIKDESTKKFLFGTFLNGIIVGLHANIEFKIQKNETNVS